MAKKPKEIKFTKKEMESLEELLLTHITGLVD